MTTSKKSPPKPSDLAIWVYEHEIYGVQVEYVQTGTDTADTCVVITDENGKSKTVWWRDLKPLVNVEMSHRSIMRANKQTEREVEAWKAWEKEHKSDLVEYLRLKDKLGL